MHSLYLKTVCDCLFGSIINTYGSNPFFGISLSLPPDYDPDPSPTPHRYIYTANPHFPLHISLFLSLLCSVVWFKRRSAAVPHFCSLDSEDFDRWNSTFFNADRYYSSSVLELDEQTINRPAPSVGGRLDYGVRSPRDPRLGARESGRNDISPPYLPFSRLSEYLEQCYSEYRRSIDFIARHNQLSSVMRSPQVDEGDLEDREDDEHEEMRRDVDDMSYAVAIGLSEEAILAGVGRHSYRLPNLGSPVEEERCCICQEEYVEGVELGKLDCGHECHFNCIEQWLMLKNACPLCKRAAVAV